MKACMPDSHAHLESSAIELFYELLGYYHPRLGRWSIARRTMISIAKSAILHLDDLQGFADGRLSRPYHLVDVCETREGIDAVGGTISVARTIALVGVT